MLPKILWKKKIFIRKKIKCYYIFFFWVYKKWSKSKHKHIAKVKWCLENSMHIRLSKEEINRIEYEIKTYGALVNFKKKKFN
jgi:hypothetical protein